MYLACFRRSDSRARCSDGGERVKSSTREGRLEQAGMYLISTI